jgi:hypothetical protein
VGLSIEARPGRVALVIDDVGEVLVQGSATYDVEYLQTSTDCKEWQIPLCRSHDERRLKGVPAVIGNLGRRTRDCPIG